ncbi:MAG TPA: SHD1 domain-containing protein, partial [Lacipirellulaceae bacterium]|nr:SHD1 domain-containing protein [Lacipirellulaceae bacterium]
MVCVRLALLVVGIVGALSAAAFGRIWTDSTGRYTVDASLLAFNDKHVVLERADSQLLAVPLDKLSQADRDYLKSREAVDAASGLTGAMQTWTLNDGARFVGRVVDYAHKEITLQRRRGRIYVNDRLFDNLPEVYQHIIPLVVAHFDRLNNPTRQGLESWLVRQRGEPRSFSVDGVVLEVENGDEYVVPFFLFSDEDLAVLKPGWEHWLANHQDYNLHEDSAFRLQSLAAAYQRDRQ